ncbi:MAG: protein kinase, partial [archaeon]|nr:protein kinase [archaeon]
MKRTLSKNRNMIIKTKTLPFDRRNFIHIKKGNIKDMYTLDTKLGSGASGAVYKAANKKTGLIRAIKLISKKRVQNKDFDNELLLFKSLDHPNIVKLYDCYVDDSSYYLVEEYCSGGDLFDFIKNQKTFTEKKVACIINQLLGALNYLHSKKIVHRDIKPENIVIVSKNKENKNISKNGTKHVMFKEKEEDHLEIFIKLIDFGISIFLRDEPLKQEIGTIYYIAPEVFKNNYNEKADIWSVGIILYTMLCGHP